MNSYGLTQAEQDALKPLLLDSSGICESQEKFMSLVQMPEAGGFSLAWSDRLRKSIAKKNPAEFEKLQEEYFKEVPNDPELKEFIKSDYYLSLLNEK